MPRFIVHYTSMAVEADDADAAIEEVTVNDRGGGSWEAVPFTPTSERDEYTATKAPCTDDECWCWESDGPDTCEEQVPLRLEYLRGCVRAERMSWGELHELQSLAPFIDRSDVELLEAAGVPATKTTTKGDVMVSMDNCVGCAEGSPPGRLHAIDCPNREDEGGPEGWMDAAQKCLLPKFLNERS